MEYSMSIALLMWNLEVKFIQHQDNKLYPEIQPKCVCFSGIKFIE